MLNPKRSKSPSLLFAAIAILTALSISACRGGSVDSDLAKGDAAMEASNFADAQNAYQDAIKAAPDDARGYAAMGNLYLAQHNYAAAQTMFMKALDSDPKSAEGHAGLGNYYAAQGQGGLAEDQLRAAVALAPARPDFRLQLADVLRKGGKTGAAEVEMRTAIGLDPKNAQAHFALATMLSTESGATAEANAEFDQARALNPLLVPGAPVGSAAAPPAPAPATAAMPPGVTPPGAMSGAMPPANPPATAGAPMVPGANPAAVASAPPPAAAAPRLKPLNRLFLLTQNTAVYTDANASSAVVGQVTRKKYVHVTGMAGDWLQIKLKDGTVGFIPISAAE
ncbi:MAG TPA: tetratricopeptide repeat protein [Candidatus Binataceae bacterium]